MTEPFSIDYDPPPVLSQFMLSDARVRAVRGPVGSGKSTAMVVELLRRGIQQEPGRDGIRRTKWAIVRNTLSQLRTTCLDTIRTVLGPLADWKPSKNEVHIVFDDVHIVFLLLPLDTPQNVQRLLSLELTGAWISEFREIPPQLAHDVFSRCSRYPSNMNGGPSWWGMIMETNSFTEDSGWYKQLELELPTNWDYFVQPAGVTIDEEGNIWPTGENCENLDPEYYLGQIEGNGGIDSEWCKQYVLNQIGPSLSGEAVFTNSFFEKFHVSETGLLVTTQLPLCIGMDTGRNPAAVLTQMDSHGVLNVVGEAYGVNMGIEKFLAEVLRPMLSGERYAGCPLYCVIDPAGKARGEVGEESVLEALKRLGFAAVLAQTNNIAPRLRAVEKLLQQQRGGKAALRFDAEHCPDLVTAMKSQYRFRKKTNGELDDKPDKKHPWSDLADALQYACLGGSERIQARAMRSLGRAPVQAERMPVGAWT